MNSHFKTFIIMIIIFIQTKIKFYLQYINQYFKIRIIVLQDEMKTTTKLRTYYFPKMTRTQMALAVIGNNVISTETNEIIAVGDQNKN